MLMCDADCWWKKGLIANAASNNDNKRPSNEHVLRDNLNHVF